MQNIIRFNVTYFFLWLFLTVIEILIGAYLHDSIIRPYGGDFLVVIWLYCLVRCFLAVSIVYTAAAVLLFSYIVEISQYFHLADRLGFKGPSLMRTLLGSYFTWSDILAYTLGILSVLALEGWARRRKTSSVVN